MFTRLTNFLEVNQILYPRQYGFRPGFSTTFSLIDITETIRNSIDQKKFGCGIFLDLKKAFDTVNHDMLLTKLEHYGIRDISLNWFKSYLSDRKQFVHINGQNSSLCDIVCGVPQGSVLGPLLFLLYVNDLPNISKKLNFFLFADDTNIYLDSFNLYSLQTTVNKELSKLYDWLCINRLSLNISKTNFVIFKPPNKPTTTVTILIDKIAIKEESFVKYLGIYIDSKLTFKFHIEELKKKVSRSIGIICKLKPFVSTKLLINIYYAIVYPFLLYGIVIWGNSSKYLLNSIHLLQKRFVRNITNNFGSWNHTAPLFSLLNILTIFDIYKLQLGLLIHDYKNSYGPVLNIIKFNDVSSVHNYNTRSALRGDIYINNVRTTQYALVYQS